MNPIIQFSKLFFNILFQFCCSQSAVIINKKNEEKMTKSERERDELIFECLIITPMEANRTVVYGACEYKLLLAAK